MLLLGGLHPFAEQAQFGSLLHGGVGQGIGEYGQRSGSCIGRTVQPEQSTESRAFGLQQVAVAA